MKKLEIYDPAMCCSTGVCGPEPDQELIAFAGMLKKYDGKADIQRHNLSQDPAAFASNPTVGELLKEEGPEALPFILVNGKLVMKGVYPTQPQLDKFLGSASDDACCSGDDDCCADEEKPSSHASSCCDDDTCC